MLQCLFQTRPSGIQIMMSLASLTTTDTVFGDLSLWIPCVLLHTAMASCCTYIILLGCKNNYFGTLKWKSTNTELCITSTRSEVWLEEDAGQVLWKAEGIWFVLAYGSPRRLDMSQSPAIHWGLGFFWLPFATHYRQIFSKFFKRFLFEI